MREQAVRFRRFLTIGAMWLPGLFGNSSLAQAGVIDVERLAEPSDNLLCSYVYEFNFHDPLIRQKPVRQAIHAMLFSTEISRGLGEPLHFVLPSPLWQAPERLPSTGASERYLAELDAHTPLSIVLHVEPSALNHQVATRVARMLSQSDLFRVSVQDSASQFQLSPATYCTSADDPVRLLARFHSQSLDNDRGYHHPQIDHWLEQLQASVNVAEREALIAQIVLALQQDIAVLPLFEYGLPGVNLK